MKELLATARDRTFLLAWIAANGVAELVGLGAVALLGFYIVGRDEPQTPSRVIASAAILVLLGAVEGLVVGAAQAWVLKRRVPELRGWTLATLVGALLAWTICMLPSTLLNIQHAGGGTPPPQISEPVRLLLAAGLGLVAGPILALAQCRPLRHHARSATSRWLLANAVAWALGMPIIFAGAHVGSAMTQPWLIASTVGASLLVAGAVVGAVHGLALLRLFPTR